MEIVNSILNALAIDSITDQLSVLFPKTLAGILIIGLSWLMSKIARRIVREIFEYRDLDRDIEELVEQVVEITIMIIGVVTGLGTIGINVGALVASLGLVGFAIGFALKDAISNFLAGVLILVYRPFKRGDYIIIGVHKGTVSDIDLRYTMLDTEKEAILVPNAHLFSNVVKVVKENPEVP
jgi:small-conductance mechanosensitive channel